MFGTAPLLCLVIHLLYRVKDVLIKHVFDQNLRIHDREALKSYLKSEQLIIRQM